ncbi:hypothetical protein M885DRAFT_524864 [Pelagophyceae sp. CCMP2097]|nr:hypothetical protein M885DRAFT_524864 [Pelagophyceae sp. CCMP2097]
MFWRPPAGPPPPAGGGSDVLDWGAAPAPRSNVQTGPPQHAPPYPRDAPAHGGAEAYSAEARRGYDDARSRDRSPQYYDARPARPGPPPGHSAPQDPYRDARRDDRVFEAAYARGAAYERHAFLQPPQPESDRDARDRRHRDDRDWTAYGQRSYSDSYGQQPSQREAAYDSRHAAPRARPAREPREDADLHLAELHDSRARAIQDRAQYVAEAAKAHEASAAKAQAARPAAPRHREARRAPPVDEGGSEDDWILERPAPRPQAPRARPPQPRGSPPSDTSPAAGRRAGRAALDARVAAAAAAAEPAFRAARPRGEGGGTVAAAARAREAADEADVVASLAALASSGPPPKRSKKDVLTKTLAGGVLTKTLAGGVLTKTLIQTTSTRVSGLQTVSTRSSTRSTDGHNHLTQTMEMHQARLTGSIAEAGSTDAGGHDALVVATTGDDGVKRLTLRTYDEDLLDDESDDDQNDGRRDDRGPAKAVDDARDDDVVVTGVRKSPEPGRPPRDDGGKFGPPDKFGEPDGVDKFGEPDGVDHGAALSDEDADVDAGPEPSRDGENGSRASRSSSRSTQTPAAAVDDSAKPVDRRNHESGLAVMEDIDQSLACIDEILVNDRKELPLVTLGNHQLKAWAVALRKAASKLEQFAKQAAIAQLETGPAYAPTELLPTARRTRAEPAGAAREEAPRAKVVEKPLKAARDVSMHSGMKCSKRARKAAEDAADAAFDEDDDDAFPPPRRHNPTTKAKPKPLTAPSAAAAAAARRRAEQSSSSETSDADWDDSAAPPGAGGTGTTSGTTSSRRAAQARLAAARGLGPGWEAAERGGRAVFCAPDGRLFASLSGADDASRNSRTAANPARLVRSQSIAATHLELPGGWRGIGVHGTRARDGTLLLTWRSTVALAAQFRDGGSIGFVAREKRRALTRAAARGATEARGLSWLQDVDNEDTDDDLRRATAAFCGGAGSGGRRASQRSFARRRGLAEGWEGAGDGSNYAFRHPDGRLFTRLSVAAAARKLDLRSLADVRSSQAALAADRGLGAGFEVCRQIGRLAVRAPDGALFVTVYGATQYSPQPLEARHRAAPKPPVEEESDDGVDSREMESIAASDGPSLEESDEEEEEEETPVVVAPASQYRLHAAHRRTQLLVAKKRGLAPGWESFGEASNYAFRAPDGRLFTRLHLANAARPLHAAGLALARKSQINAGRNRGLPAGWEVSREKGRLAVSGMDATPVRP